MTLKLPRGRVPVDSGKMLAYIKNVADMNGVDFNTAQAFVIQRSPTAAAVVSGSVLPAKPSTKPMTGSIEPKPSLAPAKIKTVDEIIAESAARFDRLHTLVRGAFNGAVRSLIVSGAGGTGKTFAIQKIAEYYKETKGSKFEVVTGGMITPVNLYKLLWRNREPNAVTILDDSDTVWDSDNSIALLKAALDTSIERKLSWLSETKALADEGIDNSFKYYGACIFLTNVDFQELADKGTKKSPHIQAMLTRSMYFDMKLRQQRELMIWIKHVVEKNGILIQDGLKPHQQEEILKFMMENSTEFRSLSIRTAMKLSSFYKMDHAGWKGMAAEIEFRPK
jgi:hypothetical protein